MATTVRLYIGRHQARVPTALPQNAGMLGCNTLHKQSCCTSHKAGMLRNGSAHHLHDAPAVECPTLWVIQPMSLSPELDLHTHGRGQQFMRLSQQLRWRSHAVDRCQDVDLGIITQLTQSMRLPACVLTPSMTTETGSLSYQSVE